MKVIGILLIILSTGSPLAVASPALGGDAALSQEVLPKYTRPLPRGINRLTVVNPNDYDARVGLRAGKIMSRNFVVRAHRSVTISIPNGRFNVFFQFSNQPDALFQGDQITVESASVTIKLVAVQDGNYGISQVK
ncbi:MAG: hypothetical protein ACLQIB_53480 [Isosphaeraceae bacterium]